MKTIRSLSVKLMLSFMAVSLMGIVLAAAFVGLQTRRSFEAFVDSQSRGDLAGELAEHYRTTGDWTEAAAAFEAPPPPDDRRPFFVVDEQGVVVVAGGGHQAGTQVSTGDIERGTPVEVDGEVVGTLVFGRGEPDARPPRSAFLGPFERGLVIGAALAALAALLLGILLARSLTRPLRDLTAATRAVAAGDLARQVDVRSKDELGELAQSFNQMSADLARARDLRRQMTADIAHELRTPLSLILGHSEALSEGMLPPTAETLHVIHDEAKQLRRLVEDLRLLTLSETRELQLAFERVSPQTLVERAANAYLPQAAQKGITLEASAGPDLPPIDVDPDRMAQVLDNLINNALEFTPADGAVWLSATKAGDEVQIIVQDSGPGVEAGELSSIFERFYRGDKARQRHEGGAGLGLAIARSLVEAHGGRIWAESPPGEGLRVIVALPVDHVK